MHIKLFKLKKNLVAKKHESLKSNIVAELKY